MAISGLVLAAAVGTYLFVGVDLTPHEEDVELQTVAADTLPAPPSAYGIPLAGFHVERDQVRSGSSFSQLLAPLGISAATIDSLVQMAVPVFDVTRIRAGHPVAFIFSDDATCGPAYFVYESDPVDHVVFDLRRPYSVHMEKRPVHTEEKSLSVAVTGALWNDLVNAGASPALAAELSEVFAWTVDFYRIQEGDRFTMVYRQNTVDGKPYGGPKLLCVRYEGLDTKEAFLFDSAETKGGYYDAEGKSLRKAFLQAPLKYSRISSGFSLRRFHPVQKRFKAHLGTDYAAPYGTPIQAVGDGVVERAGYSGGNGSYVESEGEVVWHQVLPRDVVERAVAWMEGHGLAFYLESNTGLFGTEHLPERTAVLLGGATEENIAQVRKGFPHMIYDPTQGRDEGNKISAYINNTLMKTVTDARIKEGQVGISVSSFDDTPVIVSYDTMVISEP